jgi:hypothetical protein
VYVWARFFSLSREKIISIAQSQELDERLFRSSQLDGSSGPYQNKCRHVDVTVGGGNVNNISMENRYERSLFARLARLTAPSPTVVPGVLHSPLCVLQINPNMQH